MLDVCIRVLAHVLTPLFLVGMAGSSLIVIATFTSDVIAFFRDEESDELTRGNQ